MRVTLYGIKTCDTMKKARTWLDEQGIDYAFHDYKSSGIDRGSVERWCDTAGWETVLNRAGTTFRKLPETEKGNIDRERAIALMLEQPSMIKRPVLETEGRVLVGFKPDLYDHFFAG